MGGGDRGLQNPPRPPLQRFAFKLFGRDAVDQANRVDLDNVEQAKKTLQTDAWLLRRMETASLEEDAKTMDAWRAQRGAQMRDDVIHHLPHLGRHAPCLAATPLRRDGQPLPEGEPSVTLLDWFCPFAVQVPRIVSCLEKKTRRQNRCSSEDGLKCMRRCVIPL